jgi:3-oxoadipate enol-lactonase
MRLWHDVQGPGDAPVLVLPCSLGTSRELWDAALYADRFRVLRYEHRGHGESDVPRGPYSMEELARDALELLDGLGVEHASWIGVSLGGMVGMWLAAHVPERLDRIVLACTSARMPAPEAYRERAVAVREQGLEPLADAVVSGWFTPEAPDELSRRFRAILVATPAEGYAGCCEALAAWDFRSELPRVAVPTLVIAGERDEATPAGDTQLLAETIPDARFALIRDAGHLANVERPQEFAAAARSHLEDR